MPIPYEGPRGPDETGYLPGFRNRTKAGFTC